MLKSRLLFSAGVLLACAVVIVYEDKNIGFTVLYTLAVLFALSLCSALLARRFIKIEQHAESGSLFKNESLSYTLRIRNRGPLFYPGARYVWHNPGLLSYDREPAKTGSLKPGSNTLAVYEVSFPYRGLYHVGLESVTATDFLGLFKVRLFPGYPAPVVVYPEINSEFTLNIRRESQSSGPGGDTFSEDYSSVADVRRYVPSDSLRKIHWKLSAKRGELIVKNFQPFVQDKLLMFLDTRRVPLTGGARAAFEDKMVSYAASAVSRCIESRLPASLFCGDSQPFIELDCADEIDRVFTLLAGIEFNGARFSLTAAQDQANAYNMLLFISGIDNALYEDIRALGALDRRITLYYFHGCNNTPEDKTGLFLDGLRASGVSVNEIGPVPAEVEAS